MSVTAPDFPLAEQMVLSPRWQRDLTTLTKMLKLTSPTELLTQWQWFVGRMTRAGEVFEVPVVADYLLREVYLLYEAEVTRQAAVVAAMAADPRVPEGELARMQMMYEQQLAHRENVWQVMPELRGILHGVKG